MGRPIYALYNARKVSAGFCLFVFLSACLFVCLLVCSLICFV